MDNPARPGAFSHRTVTYASPGLDYASEELLRQYRMFGSPDPGFETPRVDISRAAEFGGGAPWPFPSTQAPLNGLLCVPDGDGPFPLALFAHGNHSPVENSTPGYLYLCRLLASHGVIAGTVDANFLNGRNFGENDGRGLLHLEHVKQMIVWHGLAGHPLEGRIDTTRIALVGHSRGGEGVGHAAFFNTLDEVRLDNFAAPIRLDGTQGLGPYHFALAAVVAIAPTDLQYLPVGGPEPVTGNFLVIHGARDGDVSTFDGYKTYDRSHRVNLADPLTSDAGDKALAWVHGANHNYFNSEWGQDNRSDVTMTRHEQESVAKVIVGGFLRAHLLGEDNYLELFERPGVVHEQGWIAPHIALVTQRQRASRAFVQHFQEGSASPQVSAPFIGDASLDSVVGQPIEMDLGPFSHLHQETTGLRLEWTSLGGAYTVDIDPDNVDLTRFAALTFRIGQSFESENVAGAVQDFALELADQGASITLVGSRLNRLLFPDERSDNFEPKTVMQTFRVGFDTLSAAGVDPEALTRIRFRFDQTESGVVYLDDLQFST